MERIFEQEKLFDWVPLMEFEKFAYLRRYKKFYKVSSWKIEDQIPTMLGNIRAIINYYHSPVRISPPDSSQCYPFPPRRSNSFHELDNHIGEPFRLEISVHFPDFALLAPHHLLFEFSCVVPSFRDTDPKFVFDVPSSCMK